MNREQSVKLSNRSVGTDYPPFIVAEMSGNHNQTLDRAIEIVDAVAKTGAHAIKLQTYTADTMTLNLNEGEFRIDDPESLWYGESLYQLYDKAHTPWEWHKPIYDRCKENNLICFSTPFDETAIDFLESLNNPIYKVASFENTDLPLVRKIASTGKPIIISTGMATLSELDETVRTARESGCKHIVLLKCTSNYPASTENSNVATISHLKDLFKCQIGLSDHTLGIGAALASISFGATFIEKHVTLSRVEGGVDSSFSLEPSELEMLVVESKRAWQAIGKIQYGPDKSENASLQFRRSIYVAQNIKAGEIFTEENIRTIRPGFGLPPKYYPTLLGKKVNKDVKMGTPLSWDMIG